MVLKVIVSDAAAQARGVVTVRIMGRIGRIGGSQDKKVASADSPRPARRGHDTIIRQPPTESLTGIPLVVHDVM